MGSVCLSTLKRAAFTLPFLTNFLSTLQPPIQRNGVSLDKPMEAKIFKSLIMLGVPGVSIGAFFLLLRSFNFTFETIPAVLSGTIALVFLLVVGAVTLFALDRYAPKKLAGHGVAFSIPKNGATFKAVVSALVASEQTTVTFENFTQDELDSVVASQDISAPTVENAILRVRGLTDGIRPYEVTKTDFGGYAVIAS